jgi:hypothetical protein
MENVLFLLFLVVTIVFISKNKYIGYWFKYLINVSVEEPIVNAPLVNLNSKNTNNAKSGFIFKQLVRDPNPWCIPNRHFNANFEEKFTLTPDITYIHSVEKKSSKS